MKLLTFFGRGPYSPTIYQWQDQQFETAYAPAAVCRMLKPETLVVFVTDAVRRSPVFAGLQAEIPPQVALIPVAIPLGRDEAELWQIFDVVSRQVAPGEAVSFDVTHGLRSFPLVGLLAAAFLQSALAVRLERVFYGAYDVGRELGKGITPLFDLSPMLSLLGWASAAERFNSSGDARPLAALIEDQRRSLALGSLGDHPALREVEHLRKLSLLLNGVSQALRLNRPRQAMAQIASLPEKIERAQPALARSAPAQPFRLLLDQIQETYQTVAYPNGQGLAGERDALAAERRLIAWYVAREQWVQAVSLAREWLLNWVMVQRGIPNLAQLSARHQVEKMVNGEANRFKQAKTAGRPFTPGEFGDLPQVKAALGLWLSLTEVRNDIAHAGYREAPGEADRLVGSIRSCLEQINQLPL